MNQHWELLLNDTSEMVAEWKVGGRWSKSLSWVLLSETQLTAWLIFYQLIRIRFKPLTSPSHYQSPTHHHDIGLKFGFIILKGLFPEWGGRLTGSATDLKVGCKIWLGGCLLIFSSLAHMRWSSFCQIYGYIMREKKYQEQLNGKTSSSSSPIIMGKGAKYRDCIGSISSADPNDNHATCLYTIGSCRNHHLVSRLMPLVLNLNIYKVCWAPCQ